MIKISAEKLYNAYLIETYNYKTIKNQIIDFALTLGFDKTLIEAETHPDIMFLESEDKIIPIDDIRERIIDTINLTPKICDRKIYVIYDAKNIVEASENAMLKTLEEPPEFISIFLVTNNIKSLLATIRSRCQIIKDTDDFDYKDLLNINYIDMALKTLANLKYDTSGDKMNFIENALLEDNNLKNLIKIYRIAIRDAFVYKTTLSKTKLILREKEDFIISIANSFTLEELGHLSDRLDTLSLTENYNVNKKIAALNFLLT